MDTGKASFDEVLRRMLEKSPQKNSDMHKKPHEKAKQ